MIPRETTGEICSVLPVVVIIRYRRDPDTRGRDLVKDLFCKIVLFILMDQPDVVTKTYNRSGPLDMHVMVEGPV